MIHSPINTIHDETYAQLETTLFELGAMERRKRPLWKNQEREHSTFSQIS